jgi:monoterpene epsilon-lactone hydrolase
MNPPLSILVTGLLALMLVVTTASAPPAQDKSPLAQAPTLPEILVDADGTIHWGPRSIPLPALASPEAREAYAKQMVDRAKAASARAAGAAQGPQSELNWVRELIAASKQAALKTFPVEDQEQKIGGIAVSVYTPKSMPAKNRNKVALEFEVDSEAVAVASLAQMKVISVHYRLSPRLASHEDIVAVYRELLKTYKPKNIGMFGTSGGCLLAQTTVLWLPQLKLPFPGALGLITCAGGTSPGDTRFTNNGLDATLSTAFTGAPPFGGAGRATAAPRKSTDPPRTPLEGEIPKGYPPAFLLSGTRDMCLSETVLLHRKLRNAGIEADLNIFEGMWHGFHGNPNLPESREAMSALAKFFESHLGK